MLLTISAGISGGDLGYLLHKNPSRLHSFDLPFGKAHVFYSELGPTWSQAALLLDVDPVGLVRGQVRSSEPALYQYVNDRPYAASSFLSVAISRVFGTTMSGRSKERQVLADQPLPLEAVVTALPCRGGEEFLHRLFEPLKGQVRLGDLLTHVYVLVPVLDAEKHYWVGADEVDKLLKKGEGWLSSHPERDTIVARYLRFDRKLTRSALARLTDEDASDPEAEEIEHAKEEGAIEAPLKLWEQRIGATLSVLRGLSARTVVDLGCGEGKLLQPILEDRSF